MKTALLLLALTGSPEGVASTPTETPAQERIARAQLALDASPDRFQTYNDLAFALARRARETAESAFYDRALVSLERSFELQPDNLEGRKVQTWILLGQHRFADALELAKELNERVPDDVFVYGLLVDAHVELGNYAEAEEAAQWMLDLRAGSVPALTRVAYLRELFGDTGGAIDMMVSAFQRVDPTESEDRAWILTHIAHLELQRQDVDAADKAVAAATKIFPDYHYALAVQARVLAAKGELQQAADVLGRRYKLASHPENLFEWAEMLDRAGEERVAASLFARFEEEALAESENVDNANGELVSYYADHAQDPAEALRVATLERDRRADVRTRASYAWALFLNGEVASARDEIDEALAVGLQDAQILRRAAVILAAAGEDEKARVCLRESLAADPSVAARGEAMALLGQLEEGR